MASSRYARQISLPEVGGAGQVKLGKACVLCVGVGGLGNAVVQSLVSAGVGKILLCDSDEVSLSNLARQPLYTLQDVGQRKVNVLVRACRKLNAEVTVIPISEDISTINVKALLCEADAVVDCTDNAEAKYLLNRHCVADNKPLITASLSQWAGYCMMVHGQGCYRCVFPEENAELPTCSEAGVISTLPALVGQVQASLVLLCLLGLADEWRGKLWSGDLKRQRFGVFDFEADPECSICANGTEKGGGLGADQSTLIQPVMRAMTLSELAMLGPNDKVCLLDVRTDEERLQGHMGGDHVPLDQLQEGLSKLDKHKQWVVYCHSGVRSEQACRWMLQAGFSHVSNLLGGYAAWLANQQSA